MKIKLDYKYLCIVGDIHGEFRELAWTIDQKKFEDTAFIVAGDFGLGFYKKGYYEREYQHIKKKLESGNNCILGLRGNHDDPEYYNPESELFLNYPVFKALPDYTRLTWGDREILVIGGATSTDKDWRIAEMSKKPEKKLWWEDERPIKDFSRVEIKEDIIISHEAPLNIGPVLMRTSNLDLETYRNIIEDREYLGKVLKESRPSRYYFGHYHCSTSGDWGETLWKGLDINEIVEVRQ